MPPLATTELNVEGIELIKNWISRMRSWELGFASYIEHYFEEGFDPLDALADADPDRDGFSNYDEFTLKQSPVDADAGSLARLIRNTTGFVLEVELLSDRHTWIEMNQDLKPQGWMVVAESRYPAENSQLSIPIGSQNEMAFYRVQVAAH
jgi:hypothetical protein